MKFAVTRCATRWRRSTATLPTATQNPTQRSANETLIFNLRHGHHYAHYAYAICLAITIFRRRHSTLHVIEVYIFPGTLSQSLPSSRLFPTAVAHRPVSTLARWSIRSGWFRVREFLLSCPVRPHRTALPLFLWRALNGCRSVHFFPWRETIPIIFDLGEH